MREEFFDVVDLNDQIVDRRSAAECLNRGLLHRAIVVFLFNPRSELYVQRRSMRMSWYPGHWTVSCTGHVSSGETYVKAAKREVNEELGLDCALFRVTKFVSPKWKYHGKTEWEYTTIFEGKIAKGAITLSGETQEGKFMTFHEFERMSVLTPDAFTPDTLFAFQHYKKKRSRRVDNFEPAVGARDEERSTTANTYVESVDGTPMGP